MDEDIDYQKEIDSLSKMIKGPADRGELMHDAPRKI